MKPSRLIPLAMLSLMLLVAGVIVFRRPEVKVADVAPSKVSNEVKSASAAPTTAAPSSEVVQTSSAAPPDNSSTERRFAAPAESNAAKLRSLDRLTQPTADFESTAAASEYWAETARTLKAGAEQVLAASPTDAEASQAVQFKAEGLRLMAMQGDENAAREHGEFLDACLKDPRFDVSSVVAPLRMLPTMRRWTQLDSTKRTAAFEDFIADVKAAGPTPHQAKLLLKFADSLSDSSNPLDVKLATGATDELLSTFQEGLGDNNDPAVQDLLATLIGLNRRLHLPGNSLELEGMLFDGKPFDWEAYRGKVVLVDFWASWCPECLKEVPAIREAYGQHRDQGFEVIGISLDNNRKLAEQSIRQHGITWPQLFTETPAGDGWNHPMQRKYAVMVIPRAILVDRQGKVVTTMARGPILNSSLQKLLGASDNRAASSNSKSSAPRTGRPTSR